MKKLISILIVIILLFALFGCTPKRYSAPFMCFIYEFSGAIKVKNYSEDVMKKVVDILNGTRWEDGLKDATCHFEFDFSDSVRVQYDCELGILNDLTNNISSILSVRDYEKINDYLDVIISNEVDDLDN